MLHKSTYSIILIAAIAVLSGCAKVQPDGAGVPDISITYQVASGELTKAAYDTDQPAFGTAAYYSGDINWANVTDYTTVSTYIPKSEVAYRSSTPTDAWTTETAYYWPVDGGFLTFFSYSPFSVGDAADVKPESGVILTDWDVITNSSVDFMVADIAADQTANTTDYPEGGTALYKGVPTVFRHKLSKVTFNVSADAELQNRCILYSVRLVNVYQQGTYTQFGEEGADDVWSRHSDAGTPITVYNADGLTVPTVSTQTGDSMFMIPQELTNSRTEGGSDVPCVEIVYSYLTSTNRDNPVKVTATVPLTEFKITGTETASTEWSAGYSIVYNIAFGGAPILFNPIYGDWGNGGDFTIIL